MTTPVGISALERVEALIDNPALYVFAEVVPEQAPHVGGRPRHYPPYAWVLFDALLSIYGSGRRVEAELAHPLIWNRIRQLIEHRFADQPDLWLPDRPIRRHHYLYGRSRYLTTPHVITAISDIHRRLASDQARSIGLLNPDGPGSWTHPDLSRVIHADGKVITPLFKAEPGTKEVNRITGEIHYPRVEHDAALHFEGTGDAAWGCKYVIVATRDTHTNARIILDTAHVPHPGNEAAIAIDIFRRLAPHIPGGQAVIYDGALRGVHTQTLLRDLGLLTINKVQALAGTRTKHTRTKTSPTQRVEKTVYVETKTINPDTKPAELKLFARAGQIGITELTDTGEPTFLPLERIRTHRNPDKAGTYRWYNDYRLPPEYGNGTITVRLHTNDDDNRRRFNRAENVRPIPPGDPDFARLYGRRNDAESINRHLDDTLWLRRAHTIGHQRQTLNLLTYALGINALALHLHRGRSVPTIAA